MCLHVLFLRRCFFHSISLSPTYLSIFRIVSLKISLSLYVSLSLYPLLITCTCCYDQTKGTQDKDFSYSFSDSLSLYISLPSCMPSLCVLDHFKCLGVTYDVFEIYLTLTLACTCCYDETKGTQDQDLFSFSDSLSRHALSRHAPDRPCSSVCAGARQQC